MFTELSAILFLFGMVAFLILALGFLMGNIGSNKSSECNTKSADELESEIDKWEAEFKTRIQCLDRIKKRYLDFYDNHDVYNMIPELLETKLAEIIDEESNCGEYLRFGDHAYLYGYWRGIVNGMKGFKRD